MEGRCSRCYLVDSTQRGHIHGLPPDCAGTTDTGGVLPGAAVDDGVDQHLQGVLGKGRDWRSTGKVCGIVCGFG